MTSNTPPVYVCSTQEMKNMRGCFVSDNHPYHIFILCSAGKGSIITEQLSESEILPGTLVYTSPAIFTAIRPISDDFSIRLLGFTGSVAASLIEYCGIGASDIIPELPAELRDDFNTVFDRGCSDTGSTMLSIYKLITRLSTVRADKTPRTFGEFIRTSFEKFVTRDLPYDIDTGNFCRGSGITERELWGLLGMPAEDFIADCRIREAKRLLVTRPDDKRETIAAYCGYSGANELEREFSKRAGETTDEFISRFGKVEN